MKSEESTSALQVHGEDKMRNIVQLYDQDRINEEDIQTPLPQDDQNYLTGNLSIPETRHFANQNEQFEELHVPLQIQISGSSI